MTTLQDLSTAETLLLFTPVITTAAAGKASNKTAAQIDPFEILGRALSRYHRRIRHVPYVPKVGFTETHDAFLSQANAAVVVICEPETAKHESLGSQCDFAEAALDGLDTGSFGRSPRHPLVVIQCGDLKESSWPDMSNFDHVLKCKTYDAETAQLIARKLFEPRK